jgi:hypothetical protein
MQLESKSVFRQRFCRRADCRTIFFICRSCDRGQQYCSDSCRRLARVKQQREASRRYCQSAEGRFNHRLNQRAYRSRLAQARPRPEATATSVTDQGSASAVILVMSAKPAGTHRQSRALGLLILPITALRVVKQPICSCCGRQGQFIEVKDP